VSSEPAPPGPRPADDLIAVLNGPSTGAAPDPRLAAFARAYARRADAKRGDAASVERLAAQIRGLFDFVDARPPGQLAVRAYNPDPERDGWQAAGTVVEANLEDAPFLIDTVSEELRRYGLQVRAVVHPVLGVERDSEGRVTAITAARGALHRESVMHFEVDRRLGDTQLAALADDVRRVLGDLRLSVRDFHTMADRIDRMVEFAQVAGSRYGRDEIAETVAFLKWLAEDNFVFLGYREYLIDGHPGDQTVRVAAGSGLGILSEEAGSGFAQPVPVAGLDPGLRERVLGGPLLVITKTNREATVHRRVRMDYIGVKQVGPDGTVTGELRMIGLFTSKAYMEPARTIPLVRRKLEQIMEQEDLFPGSHDYKAVVAIFESFPKDELFAATAEDLRATIITLLGLEERTQVRLFVRPDLEGRSVSATVALPRDRVSTDLRIRLQNLFEERFDGESVDYHLSFGEVDPARFHFTIHVRGAIPDVPVDELEREVIAACRTWDDALSDALVEDRGEIAGHELARRYAGLFPGYYKSAAAMYLARFDVTQFERLSAETPYVVALQNEIDTPDPLTRLKLYKTGGKAPLSDLLPVLEALGLTVVEEVPTRLHDDDGAGRYLHDFGVLGPGGVQLDLPRVGDLVAGTVRAVWERSAESDSLNRLVPAAALSCRQVTILRAYRQYRQLLGGSFTKRYQNDALVRNAGVSRKLVELFEARHDPERMVSVEEQERLEAGIAADLDAIASLDDDRILRGFLRLIVATVRTNAYKDGGALPYLSFKLDCPQVPGMPKPVPRWEIFVYSPTMEGVHLRGGFVARGGIRWSDRIEDYRTEILGLMKAQMVKNAVIVPTGAKGGFVLKAPPAGRDELMEEERRQYIVLMRGMLDLTDNIAGGQVVRPRGVRVLDEDADAYLVVAADKGTAHLSDTANEVSAEYGFWLGDAYASGGSSGYDHKVLGITARGAWESVKRHFREIGRDVMTEPFTCVGIGDMSGDVFGNGMLQSPTTKLVAAFDHRHVFIDPDPDPATSFAERRRLFGLPRSSWDDYDRTLISAGGGVWPRSAKAVELSDAARVALGIDATALSPTELCQAILRAPVDLFWNGGIGTFVKASEETQADAGDRANDSLRVDGRDLRATVVAEGGNLGFTQRGRIEYALAGGRINTDAIDNSAGVDCSDHEVNLKILLAQALEAGELDLPGRDALLAQVADDVVAHVLYDNYLQVQILSQESAVSNLRLENYEDLMLELESRGLLDRELESLPASEQMVERQRSGRGMARPELCVLLAYAKRLLRDDILPSTLPDDPHLHDDLAAYFPRPVVAQLGQYLAKHALRREIIATIVTNDVINSMGITYVPRMAAETGAAADEVVKAFLVAREVSDARVRWDDVERLDGVVPADVQGELMSGVDSMVEELARWYLRHVPDIDLGREIERGKNGFAELLDHLDRSATAAGKAARDDRFAALVDRGVPDAPARFGAAVPDVVYAPDVTAVAQETGRPVSEVAHLFFLLGERLYLDTIQERIGALPANNRWQRLALRAQIDDLWLLRRQIATRVISGALGDVDGAVEAYLAARADAYQRLGKMIANSGGPGENDAAVVAVMVHQLRQVAE